MKTVGFIGLGTMGMPMAVNLLKKGYAVTVYNRTPDKSGELVSLGAEAASTPAETARTANVLITMLSDDAAIKEVFHGAEGIVNGLHPGLTVIDCSTISPELSKALFSELRGHYVDFLDAPVTGSKPAAIDGTLIFMVGGQEEAMLEQMDVFTAMGSKALYMGPSGSGSQTKLAHNTIAGINLVALAEGLSIAAEAGIDLTKFLDVIVHGGAGSKQAVQKGDKILDRDFSNQFSLKLMHKDLNLSSHWVQQLELPAPMLQSARGIYQMAMSKGLGELDMSSLIQCYEDWMKAQVSRRSVPDKQAEKSLAASGRDRRGSTRIPMNIKLQLSVYQWEQEGAFSGQNIEGMLFDLSETGLQIVSSFPLAQDMFVVIHFPQEAGLPPITGRIIRIETDAAFFRYGCLLSGLPLHTRIKLENYIKSHMEQMEAMD